MNFSSVARQCLMFACSAFAVFSFTAVFAFAQGRTNASGGDAEKFLQADASAQISSVMTAGTGFATDNILSPDHYFVGAGDVLALEIVGPLSLTVPLTVSPENIMLLPRLGEINVTGKTLSQVKVEIQRLVQNRNPNNRAYLTLQRPRTVYVRVSGNVTAPGLYTLPATMRVSSAVAIANQETLTTAKERLTTSRFSANIPNDNAPSGQYAIGYAQRNVKVQHRNGTTEIADAVRSRYMDDPAADPTIREADEIYVPFEYESMRDGMMLSIAGAVQRPCLMPYRKGDRISLLLKASYGLTENADSARVELLEVVSAGGSGTTAKTLSASRILAGGADDIELPAGASVVVREKEQATKRRGTVSVLGEVASPGVYAIEAGVTRLASVVQQAGGLTKAAHLPLSAITRREMRSLAFRVSDAELSRNAQYTTLTPEDTLRYKLDESLRRPVVACDFSAALEKNSDADNVLLQDGDVITVATNPRNVFVFGQVNKPGFVEAAEGKTAEWYVNAAGSYAPNADTARVRVIKAKNRLWLDPRVSAGAAKGTSITLEAGDQIYVPRVPDTNTDLALKRVSADLQKESLELQKSTQFWGIVVSALSVIFTGVNLYVALQSRTP